MNSTEKPIQAILDQIQKLRSLAKNNPNENEVLAATRAADKLIRKYQITEAQLEAETGKSFEDVEILKEPIHVSGRTVLWIHRLAQILCDKYGCTYYTKNVPSQKEGKREFARGIILVGRKSDCEIIQYMFSWLKYEIERLTKEKMYGKGHKECQSFSLGMVKGIQDQFQKENLEEKKAATATGYSKALVILDERTKQAKDFLSVAEPNMKKAPVTKQDVIVDAYSVGRSEGRKLQIKPGINAGQNIKKLNK